MNNKSKKISIITSILFFTLFLLIPGESSILCPEDQSQVQEGSVNAGSLIYSSFFGGVGNDHGLCIAQDNQGNIILAGLTYSSDFPTTETAYDQTHNGESDVFISKWSSDRTELIFSTVLGGSDDDNCIGTTGVSYHSLDIAVDSANNIVIYGTTTSDDFPVTSGALNETYNGNQDLFLTKLAENGSTLLFSTYLGGNDFDFNNLGNNRLVLDNEDNIYITGNTESPDFPLTPNAINDTIQTREAFISKISPDGSSVLYSTFLGGSAKEYSMGVALDSEKNIIVGGTTLSSDFPITATAFDKTYSNANLYITKIAADGSTLIYSTFVGGTEWEQLTGMIVDANDDLYFTGTTASSNFPTTSNSFRENFQGNYDLFVGKLAKNGSILLASSFLGGTNKDLASGITLSVEGDPYIVGYTKSSNFPTTANAHDKELNGLTDYILAGLNPELTELTYSTYLGGSDNDDFGVLGEADGHDAGEVIALTSKTMLMVGSTQSSDFPVTPNALNTTWNGASDVFIAQLNYTYIPSTTTTTTTTTITTTPTTTTDTTSLPASLIICLGLGTIIHLRKKRRR